MQRRALAFGRIPCYLLDNGQPIGPAAVELNLEDNDMEHTSRETNKPVYTDRRGRMKLAIFANETDTGIRFSSEITRSWKEEKEGGEGEYRSTHRLDEQDSNGPQTEEVPF